MTNRERIRKILHYQPVDRMPVVQFGYWGETLLKWAEEGHISKEMVKTWRDGNEVDEALDAKLGFDLNWYTTFRPGVGLRPGFESKIIEELPDGTQKRLNGDGVVIVLRPGAGSIPAHVDHLLKDRKAWEELYLPKLQWKKERVLEAMVKTDEGLKAFGKGGSEFLKSGRRRFHYGLHCGSLYGSVRNMLTMEGACYLLADDEALFEEVINVYADICYRCVEETLKSGAVFDFGHFWEDICFKNGPLIAPDVFRQKVGPHYRRICDLLGRYGLDIVSLDCDGCIDALVPIWIENGVNTMFPIEVGTWDGNIKPWREKYGRAVLGVGGMNKNVFARGRKAVDAEIKRLRPLVEMGGFIPCPDHRIPPDAEWDTVRYYCERMRAVFG